MPGLTLFTRIFTKVGRKVATRTAAKTVTRTTLLKSIAGTAAGTYIITAVTKAGRINSAVAETLGIPDWLSAVLIAAVIGIMIVWIASKVSDMVNQRKALRIRRMQMMENYRGERRW